MSLDKIDRMFDVLGKGVSLLTTVACVIFTGFIAYFVLGVMEYTGALLIVLTVLSAIVVGLVLRMVLFAVIYIFSNFS